jgi:hypothetical protein
MISTGNIKNILLRDVKANPVLGLIPEIVKDTHAPVTEGSATERIVIVVPGGADNGQFERAYSRVCIYIPDVKFTKGDGPKYYVPNNGRLTELENACIAMFRSGIYGKSGEEVYIYKLDTITQESDPETWSSFLNVRIKFEVVNTKL